MYIKFCGRPHFHNPPPQRMQTSALKKPIAFCGRPLWTALLRNISKRDENTRNSSFLNIVNLYFIFARVSTTGVTGSNDSPPFHDSPTLYYTVLVSCHVRL